jgi:hypothetical protein
MAEESGGAPMSQRQIKNLIQTNGGQSIRMSITTGGITSFFDLRIPTMTEAIRTGIVKK